MRLILNKALDTVNDSVNIKIIEITSTDFLNNNLDYFVYKYQIPLIKFSDTEEIFNIKNFKNELNTSLSEMELILTESDLELLSGGGGGTQDLQSVLDEGRNVTFNSFEEIQMTWFDGVDFQSQIFISYNGFSIASPTGGTAVFSDNIAFGNWTRLQAEPGHAPTYYTFLQLPNKPERVEPFILATLDDIKKIDLSDRIYANNAAAITGGLTLNDLYRTSTGELRIVV